MRKYFLTLLVICLGMAARLQVQVRNEPRHHNVFENEYVRVLDVYISPGDTTQFHIHKTPSVFLCFTKTKTGSQLMGQSPAKSSISKPGDPYFDSLTTERIHRVWNEDSTWFHVMDIELTGIKPHYLDSELQNDLMKLAFDKPMANGYNLQLHPGDKIQLPAPTTGYLLISIGEADINYEINNSSQRRFMKQGHYIWIPSGKISLITAIGNTIEDFTLLQLK